jgi:hypothetical protein
MKDNYTVLLDISIEDLNASKLLLENNLYPQSIFYFQQSTEKAIKYLGLSSNLIRKQDLLSDIGHKNLKIFKKASKEYCLKFSPNSAIDIDKQFQFIQDFIKHNDLEVTIPAIIDQINNFKTELPDLPFDYKKISTPEDLINILSAVDPQNPEIDVLKKYSNDALFKKILQENSQKFILTFPGYIKSILVLFVITCLINEHVSSVRYPDDKLINPSSAYNINNPLVASMPFFQVTLEDCINNIIEFNKANNN